MKAQATSTECQIHCLDRMSEPLGRVEVAWQLRNRLMRIVRRRLHYVRNMLRAVASNRGRPADLSGQAAVGGLQPGDRVRVKPREEIQATLDRWNRLRGTNFMEEMWPYCGTTQRVMKRVDRFLDERDYRLKRCTSMVFLEGVMCEGTRDYGRCDRSCYFFWREEWLERSD